MWTGAPLRSARTAAGSVGLDGAGNPDPEQLPQALQVSEPATLPMVQRSRTARYTNDGPGSAGAGASVSSEHTISASHQKDWDKYGYGCHCNERRGLRSGGGSQHAVAQIVLSPLGGGQNLDNDIRQSDHVAVFVEAVIVTDCPAPGDAI